MVRFRGELAELLHKSQARSTYRSYKLHKLEAGYIRERRRVWRLRKQIKHLQKAIRRRNETIENLREMMNVFMDANERLTNALILQNNEIPEETNIKADKVATPFVGHVSGYGV